MCCIKKQFLLQETRNEEGFNYLDSFFSGIYVFM